MRGEVKPYLVENYDDIRFGKDDGANDFGNMVVFDEVGGGGVACPPNRVTVVFELSYRCVRLGVVDSFVSIMVMAASSVD